MDGLALGDSVNPFILHAAVRLNGRENFEESRDDNAII